MMPQITVNRAFELPDLKKFLADMSPYPLEDKAPYISSGGCKQKGDTYFKSYWKHFCSCLVQIVQRFSFETVFSTNLTIW